MKKGVTILLFVVLAGGLLISCNNKPKGMESEYKSASEILGNPNYPAISYGGYRHNTREIQPTLEELKEDLKILAALGFKILRTYNLQFDHAPNILKAIRELKNEVPTFEMYVMLGAWIDCEGAWTDNPNHEEEDESANTLEIEKAVKLANMYPDIVKIISVGNEAMVDWAWSYYVKPGVILKYVNYLQDLKTNHKLPNDLWITSSDNFASWGGGDSSYHHPDLEALARAVDYISVHTYPFHDTYHNSGFWEISSKETKGLSDIETINILMDRASDYAIAQFNSVKEYLYNLGIKKPMHIGETGWASYSGDMFNIKGTRAADQYKQALYYKNIQSWANKNNISCFYFEAFDEPWKDSKNPSGSENHFGLITVDGKVKYALWDRFDQGVLNGLSRDGKTVTKTYKGNPDSLFIAVLPPAILESQMN
jgi:exo-beta-1,3-glucanase (GH17 family)